ncbi:MAG: sugar ABC transporter permease [Actinomycetota bacterium]|jgi:sn-glycerol 3-phosphate transport system permease protein
MTRRSVRIRQSVGAYALIAPALTLISVFIIYPFLRNFKLALYAIPPFPGLPSKWLGIHQFTTTVTSDVFLNSLQATLLYTAMVVPLGVFAGLVLAVTAHQKLRGMAIYRVIFSTTAVSSVAVAATIFGTLLNPVNGLLPWFGINVNPPFLQNTTWALPAMAIIGIWEFMGLSFLLFSAGLQSLPEEVMEAALVDGASPVRRFFRVTIPMLSPTIFYAVAVGTIAAMYTFGQMDVLIGTGSTTYTNTDTLAYLIYQSVTVQPNAGVAACISIALFGITSLITFLQFRFLERRVHYVGE